MWFDEFFFLLNFRPVAQQIDRASTRMHRLLFAWTIGALPQYHPVYSGLNRIPSVLAISRPQSKSTELPAHQHLRAPLTGMLQGFFSEVFLFWSINPKIDIVIWKKFYISCLHLLPSKCWTQNNIYVEFLSNCYVIFQAVHIANQFKCNSSNKTFVFSDLVQALHWYNACLFCCFRSRDKLFIHDLNRTHRQEVDQNKRFVV